MRLLLLLIAGFIVVMWYLQMVKSRRQKGRAAPPADAATRPLASAEPMLQCAQCGVHIPASEAVPGADGQLSYCSNEHRLRHRG